MLTAMLMLTARDADADYRPEAVLRSMWLQVPKMHAHSFSYVKSCAAATFYINTRI